MQHTQHTPIDSAKALTILETNVSHYLCTLPSLHKQLESHFKQDKKRNTGGVNKNQGSRADGRSEEHCPVKVKGQEQVFEAIDHVTEVWPWATSSRFRHTLLTQASKQTVSLLLVDKDGDARDARRSMAWLILLAQLAVLASIGLFGGVGCCAVGTAMTGAATVLVMVMAMMSVVWVFLGIQRLLLHIGHLARVRRRAADLTTGIQWSRSFHCMAFKLIRSSIHWQQSMHIYTHYDEDYECMLTYNNGRQGGGGEKEFVYWYMFNNSFKILKWAFFVCVVVALLIFI